MRTYRIRRYINGKNSAGEPYTNYSLTIPSNIAEQLPMDMQFAIELNEDGILYRPLGNEDPQNLPSWAQG